MQQTYECAQTFSQCWFFILVIYNFILINLWINTAAARTAIPQIARDAVHVGRLGREISRAPPLKNAATSAAKTIDGIFHKAEKIAFLDGAIGGSVAEGLAALAAIVES